MTSAPTRPVASSFRSLEAGRVVDTIGRLERRIEERFGETSLAKVCAELLAIARENSARARRIGAPNMPLRVAIYALIAAGAAGLLWIAWQLWRSLPTEGGPFSVLGAVETATNLLVLVGAPVFFLTRIEERLKRREALAALHELRSLIHVIDMHQLTKDPSAMSISATASSPARPLDRNQTARYLDYCSEMLSLSAKVAVLFAQGFPDTAVLESVSDIERLTAGLSQKIWQKIMIVLAEQPTP